MNQKILVAYATRVGSTAEVAQALSECFARRGLAGKIEPAALSFFERLAVHMAKVPVGDQRDWDRIRRWADGLATKLH